MKKTKLALFHSIIALVLCFSMLLGTTFAWFTDEVSSGKNQIVAGNLDIELYWTATPEDPDSWKRVDEKTNIFKENTLWEPGHTEVVYLKIVNEGTLALKYQLGINVAGETGSVNVLGEDFKLSQYIRYGVEAGQKQFANRDAAVEAVDATATALNQVYASDVAKLESKGEQVVTLVVYMPTSVGNEANHAKDRAVPTINLGIRLQATQVAGEMDSFGDNYDAGATFPEIEGGDVTLQVTTENGLTTAAFSESADGLTLAVPAGVKTTGNTLSLTVDEMATSGANITVFGDQVIRPLDVHVAGVAGDNTQPMTVTIEKALMPGLNLGNYKLFHVEANGTNEMTLVAADATFDAHNQFKYDPATGDVVLYMATFSEVALVADTENAWEGNFDYSWYTNAVAPVAEGEPDYVIANADQLAGFGAIVGGMDGQTQNSFSGKTVKLVADINLGDKESENNPDIIFYPIGYYNSEGTYERTNTAITSGLRIFEGTFDGNGHTIFNFYHNTWEMKGDHNWYAPEDQYYRDGMGLFGRVYGGTVKNLTVKNFSSDGEIATTGVIAAYADGATFENIAIFNCNPRVYNIGNGGIVGCVGWYAKEEGLVTTFKNITVDNSNKISALWGSYDVACGGIVGQYYPTSGQTSAGTPKNAGISFENCHIAAVMDVYNDVCGNYQYYAYRYAGMLIGSVRENVTGEDGRVYPDMTGITASGCTISYGNWNDYYYCEFEKNGHPSYSGPDDYKFSRVDKRELTVDENGKVTCTHNHSDVEDNRAIYLPFHNIVTGYGWGVTSKGLEDFKGTEITDNNPEKSDVKFDGINQDTVSNGQPITIGTLFTGTADNIMNSQVQVFVSPADKDSTVSAVYAADTTDWTKGTLTFSGTGSATITITDYFFCTPTTITVNVTERTNEKKFESKFTGDFLYRVGSQNAVALSYLFSTEHQITKAVEVTIETVKGNADGVYTSNATWNKGTIDFDGTGVVKVTITDNDYCIPTELYLEVIDATNLTSATGTTTGGTFVLLCDVNTSTYVNYWNCTLYGNGFEYSLKGAPTAYNSKQGKGIIITKNTVLDNVRIIGDVYNGYGAFTENDYYNTAIDVTGDTIIQNCYIANCSAPVRARNNVTIINSTLYGGAVANLIIESDTTTLENVTTANFDDGRALVGMGIVIHSDATDSAKLVLKGDLEQYNFINEGNKPSDSYAHNLYTAMFGSNCTEYHFGESPNRYVNTGIISLASNFTADDITGTVAGYQGKSLTIQGNNGYVYTQLNTGGTVDNNCPEYKPTTQGAVPPSYSFDYKNKNYIAKTDGSNDYCYEENGKVNISMDEGDTFNWDTSILTIGKGITNYTVSMNGTDYTGKSIAFNTAGDYTVTYTYTDNNNYKLDENGNITTYSVTYTKTVNITVAVVKATTKHAEFTFGSNNTASTTVTVGNNTYVMPNVSGTSSTIGSTTVDGQTIYYPIVEIIMSDNKTTHSSGWYAYFPVFSGAVTITDYANNGTGDKMDPYNGSTTTMPSGLSVVGDAKTLFKYQSGSNADTTPSVKNSKLVYSSAKIEANRSEYNTVIQYSYTDNAGATYYYYIGYHAPAQKYSPSCITPDTLITLADGSQVRVDSLKGDEQLLVWNHETGKLDKAPVAYIVNHDAVVAEHEVYHLTFANGKTVKIIGEHVFFDATLNKYVALASDAADYIGHEFLGLADNGVEKVKLVSVEKKVYETSAYEVVSYKHLTCFTNDMLSTSAYLDRLLNVFDINTDTFAYDMESVVRDIETYGLYTYADFEGLISEEAFELYDAQYLKIAIGKGYITWDDIHALIDIYFNVEVEPLN